MKDEPDIVRILKEEEKLQRFHAYAQTAYETVQIPEESLSDVSDETIASMMHETERSMRANGLENLEEKYKIIFENYAVAITLADEQERIISWNKYTEKLLNLSEKELFLKPVKSLYPPEEWEKIRAENIRRKGIKYQMETRIIRKDEGPFDVEISLCILKSVKGKNAGSVGIIKDISKLKKAEEELKESEERYKTIFENSAVAIMLTDENEQIISWNKYAEFLLGMGKEDLFKKPVKSIYPPKEWKKIRAENVRQKGMQHHLETKIIRKNNKIIDVDISLSVLKNHEGKIIGSIGVIKDITEQKLAEEALEESEKKFKQLYENAPIPYHTLSPDGIITNVSEKWHQMLGYKKEEVIGKSIFDFIIENEREPAKASFKKKILSRKPYAGGHERVYVTKDGEERIFIIHDFFSFDKDDNVKSVHTTMEDITKRKQIESALSENEEKFRDLFENASDLIQSVDASGKFIYVNKSWLRTLGYTEKDLQDLSLADILRKDQISHCMEVFKKVCNGKSFDKVETVFLSKNGREIYVEGNVNARFRDGKFVATRGIFRDITKRKQAEESLRESEKKYRTIFELSPETIILTDKKGTLLDANERVYDWLGYKQEDIIGKNLTDLPFLPMESRSKIKKKFAMRMQGKEAPPYELSFITKSKEKRIGMIYGNPIRDRNGKIIRNLVVISDITNRQRVWDEMVKSEEKYRVLAETSADGVFTTDVLGRLTYVNPSLEKILGRRKSHILATLFRGYLSDNSVYLFQQVFIDVRKNDRKIRNVDLEVIHDHGYEIPVEVNISPLKKDGKFVGIECIARDITQRKKIEMELKKSEQLKTEFMNIAAHELKSPVTPIKGYLDLIISDKDASKKIKGWARISLRNSERLLSLVNDILDVSRLDTDTMRFNMEKINSVELLYDAAVDMRLAAETKNLKFITDLPRDLPRIMGDKHRLSQVLKNLLTNAIKFTDNGSISLCAKKQQDHILISIKDTGIGISKDELKRVFTKFYQAYTGEDRRNEGAGLGLFICMEIIKKHNGDIWVESNVGTGSTFTVKLPI